MSAFFEALSQGYEPEEILKYLSKSIPQMAAPIRKATRSGYSVQQILGFLSKNFDTENRKGMTETERHSANKRADTERTKYGLKMAATAVAAPIAASAANYALSRALPNALKNLPTGMNPSTSPAALLQSQQNPAQSLPGASASANTQQMPQEAAQLSGSSQQSPNVNQVAPNLPQPQPVAQPEVKINPKEYLEKLGIKDKVDDLLKRGNSPEQAAATLGMKGGEGKLRGKIDPELLSNIDAYSKETKPETEPSIEQKKPEEIKPIAKNETVATPHGVGEVKEIRNGQAIIDVDGKLHKVKEEDLQAEPEEVRESKFDFDPDTIPEDLRSAPLNEVYLPHDRRHVTVKYNAGLKPVRYIYFRKDDQPISTDYINKIVKGVQLPVSSGKSFWGTWRADESDSRGAANYEELVSNSQEEGEPDDPSKEYWFIKEEALYEHPYLEKAGKEELRAKEKAFNEAKKKPRKKKKA